jgi:carboxymethylenebutenolidase
MKKPLLISLLLLAGLVIHSQSLVTRSVRAQQDKPKIQIIDCTMKVKFKPNPLKVSFMGPAGKTLYGWIFKPAGTGPFPAVIFNHGSDPDPTKEKVAELASLYAGHGYVFFTPHRTGHGLSKDAGESIVGKDDCGANESKGDCTVRHHEEANLDVVAAITWLKTQPYIKANRIAMTGVSYGGIQTILAAEKGLGLTAFVTHSPGAISWGTIELRNRLKTAVEAAQAPIFLLQARGDYSTGPYEVLGTYLNMKGGLNKGTLYPKFGNSNDEAHRIFAYSCQGIEIWGDDVLAFLKAAMQ